MPDDDFPARAQRAARWSLAIAASCVIALSFLWEFLGYFAIVLIAIPVFMLTDFDIYRLAFGDSAKVLASNAARTAHAAKKSSGLSRVTLFVIMVFLALIILGTLAEVVKGTEPLLLVPFAVALAIFACCVHAWRGKSRHKRSAADSESESRKP